jgi:hypothetical protein
MEAIRVEVRQRIIVLYERGKQTGEIADATRSARTSSRSWCRNGAAGTWCRWTTCGRTRRPGCAEMIELAGATLLYLPPYSPDFNPIKNM